MRPQWTHMVFSGAGFLGMTYAGVLRFLRTEGLDASIKHVAGTSVGAIFATIFALQVPIADVERLMLEKWSHGVTIPTTNIWGFMNSLGLDDSRVFIKYLESYLGNMTFMDLVKKTGVDLVMCATHLTTMSPVYFCVDKTPNVLVIDALRASIAIPLLFRPVEIGADKYVDGGISNNVPFCVYEDVDPEQVLIVHATFKKEVSIPNIASNIWTYCAAVMNQVFMQHAVNEMALKKYPHYILMKDCPIGFIPYTVTRYQICFVIPEKQIEDAIVHGYENMHTKLHQQLSANPPLSDPLDNLSPSHSS